jgi:D-arabinitol 4-dehydrogenase
LVNLPLVTLTSQASPVDAKVILHIGIGSFHRAHQAWYLHRLIAGGDTDWSLAVGSIREDMAPLLEQLARQDGAYTLETVTPQGEREYEVIRSIRRVLPWDSNVERLIEVGAQAATRIISFTVTEGGYYLDHHDHLDVASPDLAADLKGGRGTIYGTLGAILRARMERGGGPVTLLNCDNLRSNGDRFRAGLLAFLELRGEDAVRQWVLDHTSCPNSMVDRITPRPSSELAPRVFAATGFDDRAAVMSEKFIQWVIEDEFVAGRPAWENVGVELVDSVFPYEEAKIRILNASHSCIAWAGTLAGLRFIHEGTAVPAIYDMAYEYITRDVIPCLTPSPLDLERYRDVVLERFGNPHIEDTNQRVTADGFSKIPGFIVPTLRELLERGKPLDATAMLPALFFTFLQRWHLGELPYAYQDGVMDPLAAHAMLDATDPLAAFCAERQLWGDLADRPELAAAISRATQRVSAWLAEVGRIPA